MIPKILDLISQVRCIRDETVAEKNRYDVEEITSHGLTDRLAQEAREKMDHHRRKIHLNERELEKSLKTFEAWDLELKSLDPALVDFYSERDGELVYLCWKEDEPRIGFWHTLKGGFAGRQPIE